LIAQIPPQELAERPITASTFQVLDVRSAEKVAAGTSCWTGARFRRCELKLSPLSSLDA